MKTTLVAPCGMNCAICIGYLREKNRCLGCREMSKNKPETCKKCIIINCEILKSNSWKFCSDKCDKYPCNRLKNLDIRYKTKYGMSMLENLDYIKHFGVRKFIRSEIEKWKCSNCGSVFCVHRDKCLICGSIK